MLTTLIYIFLFLCFMQTNSLEWLLSWGSLYYAKYWVLSKRERLVLWSICFLFRDNGISIQLMKYQMYTEIFVFTLVIFINIVLPVGKDIVTIRIIGILNTFMTFVIHPLFYLTADVNFRNRVLHKGLWLAIKTEVFSSTSMVGPSFR